MYTHSVATHYHGSYICTTLVTIHQRGDRSLHFSGRDADGYENFSYWHTYESPSEIEVVANMMLNLAREWRDELKSLSELAADGGCDVSVELRPNPVLDAAVGDELDESHRRAQAVIDRQAYDCGR